MSKTTTNSLIPQLAEQLDFHWTNFMRPRLEGLTDDEYFWQPVPDCWTVHPDGAIDFEIPDGATWRGEILDRRPEEHFAVRYFGGSRATFRHSRHKQRQKPPKVRSHLLPARTP